MNVDDVHIKTVGELSAYEEYKGQDTNELARRLQEALGERQALNYEIENLTTALRLRCPFHAGQIIRVAGDPRLHHIQSIVVNKIESQGPSWLAFTRPLTRKGQPSLTSRETVHLNDRVTVEREQL